MILHDIVPPLHLYLPTLFFVKRVGCLPTAECWQRLGVPVRHAVREFLEELACLMFATLIDFLHVKHGLFVPAVHAVLIELALRFVEALQDHVHVFVASGGPLVH